MNVTEQLETGIKKIQEKGWIQGNLADVDGYCLVGAVNCNMPNKDAMYMNTPAIEALATTIEKECDRCQDIKTRLFADDSSGLVWRHNDGHLKSQEDALLILKKALAEV